MLPLPMNQHVAGATGVTATNPIAVSGIKSTDILLAIVKQKPGTLAAGLNPADFTVADGTLTSATVDTSTFTLGVLWTRG